VAAGRIKIDEPFGSVAELDELVRLFESCELPYERWTHRAHLAVAAVYLGRYPFGEATDRARAGIRRYNEARGDPAGYHETITVVYMRRAARELAGVPADGAPALVNDLADRCRMDWLLGYYSARVLWSAEARARFVEPDLRPLDF
jgi:hypothetical protein